MQSYNPFLVGISPAIYLYRFQAMPFISFRGSPFGCVPTDTLPWVPNCSVSPKEG